jgi:hypothetical protein
MPGGDATRCPFCRSRLKARRGVVLRQEARITSRPTLAVERERNARVQEEIAAAYARRYTPETIARLETPHAPRFPEPDTEVVPEPTPDAGLAPAPAPEPPVEQPPRARRRDRRREPRVVQAVDIELEAEAEVEVEVEVEVEAPPAHTLSELLSDYVVATPLHAKAPDQVEHDAAGESEPVVADDEVEVAVALIAAVVADAVVFEPVVLGEPDPRAPQALVDPASDDGKPRSRFARRRPPREAAQHTDAEHASLRVEVKADALKRALEPDEPVPAEGQEVDASAGDALVEDVIAETVVPEMVGEESTLEDVAPEAVSPAAREVQAWRQPRPGRHRPPKPIVASETAADEPVVDEPAVDKVAPTVEESQARRGRRFGRRRAPVPESKEAAGEEVVEI